MSDPDQIARLRQAKAHAKRDLAGIDGVHGVGIGDNCLRVYVRTRAVARRLPDVIDGVPIECIEVHDPEARPM